MPVTLHHIVVDAHDLPGLARFWAQALRWRVLSEREREVVIGPDENAPVGMCFMPTTAIPIGASSKIWRKFCSLVSSAAVRFAIERISRILRRHEITRKISSNTTQPACSIERHGLAVSTP